MAGHSRNIDNHHNVRIDAVLSLALLEKPEEITDLWSNLELIKDAVDQDDDTNLIIGSYFLTGMNLTYVGKVGTFHQYKGSLNKIVALELVGHRNNINIVKSFDLEDSKFDPNILISYNVVIKTSQLGRNDLSEWILENSKRVNLPDLFLIYKRALLDMQIPMDIFNDYIYIH